MGKYSRLGKNTLLIFIGNIGSKLISFLMLPFYTSWLSVSDYGVTDMVNIYVSFLIGIVTLCLTEAIFIFPKDRDKEEQKKFFSSGLILCTVSFIITFLLFLLLKKLFIALHVSNTFTEYTWIIYLMLVTTSLQFYTQQFSRSIDNIKVYAISGIILTLFTAILSFILIPKHGLFGYFVAQIIALLISSLYTYIGSKSYRFTSIKHFSKESYKVMLKYSIPLIPNGIMWWLISALNRPITEKYLGLHDVGIFAVSNKFPAVLMILFTIFSYSWQISVIEEFNKEGYSKFYNKMLRLVYAGLILISCVIAILSPLLVTITDERYYEAAKYMPLLCLGVVFNAFSGMVGTNFSAARKSKYYFYSSIYGAIVSIILSIILIPSLKLYGACLAVVFSHLAMAISRLFYSWQYVKVDKLFFYLKLGLINVGVIAILYFCKMYTYEYWIGLTILFSVFLYLNVDLIAEMINIIKKKWIKK